MSEYPQPFVFGYFPRNKYKDLVFYVKTGEHSNWGLFEMDDTPENRELMEALIPHIPPEEKMNDCVHYDGNPHDCSIFGKPCKAPTKETHGCYLSVAERDEMLNRCRGE